VIEANEAVLRHEVRVSRILPLQAQTASDLKLLEARERVVVVCVKRTPDVAKEAGNGSCPVVVKIETVAASVQRSSKIARIVLLQHPLCGSCARIWDALFHTVARVDVQMSWRMLQKTEYIEDGRRLSRSGSHGM
jgi:hypothetical protein